MNTIYKIWQTVDEYLLEKYFAEIRFSNKPLSNERFEACMPFIILCTNREEATDVIDQINDELKKRYDFQVSGLVVSENPISDFRIEQEKEKIKNSFKSKVLGEMHFTTFYGKKVESPLLPQMPESFTEGLSHGTFKKHDTLLAFQIVRDTKYNLLRNEKYDVYLTFWENDK